MCTCLCVYVYVCVYLAPVIVPQFLHQMMHFEGFSYQDGDSLQGETESLLSSHTHTHTHTPTLRILSQMFSNIRIIYFY